jgi:hypothetical protein
MATATAAPPLDARYQVRNSLSGKWPAILRRALWMGLFIYAFMMIGVHYIHLRLLPTIRMTLEPNLLRRPDDFWKIMALALFMGTIVGAFVAVSLALGVRSSSVAVCGDRLRMAFGWSRRVVMFRDIVGVERISVSSWPRRGSFWSDLKRQAQYVGTTHWVQHGLSQFFQSEASLVLVKVAGRKWVRGYLLDVDDPQALVDALDAAIADYVGVNGPEHRPAR